MNLAGLARVGVRGCPWNPGVVALSDQTLEDFLSLVVPQNLATLARETRHGSSSRKTSAMMDRQEINR